MKEIEFRGKAKEKYTGDWIYGYLATPTQICTDYCNTTGTTTLLELVKVDTETIGQYIGLRDKTRTKEYPEGKKIFEGDIVKVDLLVSRLVVGEDISLVYFDEEKNFIWSLKFAKNYRELYNIEPNKIKVIGNIYDNPELLEGE